MVTGLVNNQVQTQMLTHPRAKFKALENPPEAELHLSMFQFMLPDGEAVEIASQSLILIGRQVSNKHQVDLDLSKFGAQSGVSRTHVAIQITHSAVFVRDFESRNGVFLNGEILQPMEDYILRDGDELKLGAVKLRVIFVP